MSEHSILPQELAVLLAFLFLPPMLLGFVIQLAFWVGAKPRQPIRRLAVQMFALGAVGSIVSFAFLALSPQSLNPIFGVRDLLFNPFWLPIFPGGFVVFILGAFVSVRRLRRASP